VYNSGSRYAQGLPEWMCFFHKMPVRARVWLQSRDRDAHKAVPGLPEMCRERAERNQEFDFTEKDKGNKT